MADDSVENSSAEALVTLKEGGSPSKSPAINRRGMPAQKRKKYRLIFNDDEETVYANMRSPRKAPKMSSVRAAAKIAAAKMKTSFSTPDKRVAQTVGVRLRNLLKLPKAHKWVVYEWFYSNIDKVLFGGENDFLICLKETFPELKTRKLTRVQWMKIRRLMGKPRRCSAAFFEEERSALELRRAKIRLVQQRKLNELKDFKDMPEEIPMALVIGTKVTARLRFPQDGLFTGIIDALDTNTNTYRVTFDRAGLGTHSVPDYEVLSVDPQETAPLSAFQHKHRPQKTSAIFTPPRFVPGFASPPMSENDPLLGSSPLKGRVMTLEGGTYGGFPIRFLVSVTRLHKILLVKKQCIKQLKDLNTQAEKMKSYQEAISMDFQRKYATVVLELDQLNKDLNDYLTEVQEYCKQSCQPVSDSLAQLVPDVGLDLTGSSAEVQLRSEREADHIVKRVNGQQHRSRQVKSQKTLGLVRKLTSLLVQVKAFSEADINSFELKSIHDSIDGIKGTLEPRNMKCFQDNVEIHVNHIQSGLSQMGNLSAFSSALY